MNRPLRSTQAGFTLLEALVALLVMAFGMLALSGMQVSLSRNADVAKQRTEAMRLAQRKIDELRSFTSIAVAAGHTIVWDGFATVSEQVVTNATYTVDTTFGGVTADAMRPVSVAVSWLDRSGEAQAVRISSVISKSDPVDLGFIANPLPLNQPLKRPKNRNINIPIPAVELGGGKSATQFDANYVIVYSDISGGVIQICNPNQANATAAQINAAISGGACTDITGYIVAGYIGRTTSSVTFPVPPTGSDNSMNYAGVTRNTPLTGQDINCMYSVAVNQNTGAVITADNGYRYYLCAVPLSAPFTWGGTIRLGGVSTSSDYLVCRYQYTQSDLTANEKNIQPYAGVERSIDEQNYLLATSSSGATASLAGSTTACPAAMTVTGVSVGVVHQDCRSANPARATECPAASP